MTDPQIYEATLNLSTEEAKILSFDFDWPEEDNSQPTISFHESDDPEIWILTLHTVGKPDLKAIIKGLDFISNVLGREISTPEFTPLKARDWVSQSQKLNAPVFAGRYTAYGAHDKEDIDFTKTTLLIEAGQAFGTGSHGTTKGCLLALDEMAETLTPKNALDLGCGSGVLAMAIAKTWNIPVLATDNDPIAIQTTLENININKIPIRNSSENKPGVFAETSEGFGNPIFENEGPFDLVLANILAKPLCEMAKDIFNNTGQGGTLIISGLLQKQYTKMIDVFEGVGFRVQKSWPIDEWVTISFSKE